MSMVLQGRAKVRRVGNGLCVPLPSREARQDGIEEGAVVEFIVHRPRRRDPRAFGSVRKAFEGVDLQRLMDEDREGPDS